jgi:hypothetical protein
MKFKSKTRNVGPRISWEKARPAFIDPTKVELLALDFPASCSYFSLGSSSLGLFPLSSLEEAMALSKLKINSWQKQLETKHDEKMIYRPWGLRGGYIGENYTSRRNHRRKPGWKRDPGWTHHRVARPGVGPRPLVVRSHRTPSPACFHLAIFNI